MAKKAMQFGFDEKDSQRIANQTLTGSALLVQNNNFTAKEFKEKVTSKGGTTEAALKYLSQIILNK